MDRNKLEENLPHHHQIFQGNMKIEDWIKYNCDTMAKINETHKFQIKQLEEAHVKEIESMQKFIDVQTNQAQSLFESHTKTVEAHTKQVQSLFEAHIKGVEAHRKSVEAHHLYVQQLTDENAKVVDQLIESHKRELETFKSSFPNLVLEESKNQTEAKKAASKKPERCPPN